MQAQDRRALIENVRAGQLPRRRFVQQLLGVGITAPMVSMLLLTQVCHKALRASMKSET